MVKIGLIGAGKMGISHLSILGAHPDVEIVGVCDTSRLILSALERYSNYKCYTDYMTLLEEAKPDAVFVATPTRLHYNLVREIMQKDMHVFVEKPFCLNEDEGIDLISLATQRELVNQVGYHNKFVGTFKEVKRLLEQNAIGEVIHFTGEAYGPVVTKTKEGTWRSKPLEGGGCLMDYASHVIDLINDLLSPVIKANASILKSIYSRNVDDAVYALLELSNHATGVLSVNWSDETYRKMSTSITINGTKGKIISDANELKVYFNKDECPSGYSKGWNVKYITELTGDVNFYLRGEEYSAQIDHFIGAVQGSLPNNVNNFQSAWFTDRAITMIRKQKVN